MRRETAWIDPQVHLFNASLFDNLVYGNGEDAAAHLDTVLENADLADVLERLPNGMQTSLGEGGALVSGGEGQRVRMGRALGRPAVRLAILDEPARGLDRDRRQKFLQRARRHFESATLFYITHDVTDTMDFDHVLVIEQGRVFEQGSPRELYEKAGSRYRALAVQEEIVHRAWSDSNWRHLRIAEGLLSEFPLAGTAAPSGSFWQQVRAAGLVWRSGTLLGVHALETVFLFASWAAEGSGALSGRVDKGWLAAWALCLATVVLLRAAARSSEVALSIGFGGLLKERLLAGAMAFDADALRRKGIGELLSQVFEAETLEGLAMDGGLQIVLAALELLIIPFVLSWGVSTRLEILLLLSWLCLTAILIAQNMSERFRWTNARLGLTHRLVENMTAHRTKVVQQPPAEWHIAEDDETEEYAQASERLDHSTARIETLIPQGYLIAALLAFSPSFLTGAATLSQQAVTLGTILFAYMSLQRFTFGAARASVAYVAWRSIKPVFDAATKPVEGSSAETSAPQEIKTFQLQNVAFTHAGRLEPSLKNCTLTIHAGDSLLLEGDSGSGKSTLALLIAGIRRPSAGFILAGGLDLQTRGEANWRRRVAAAPQYHENHILSASLSFNLLMGRPYPHSSEDLQEARQLCLELGLGSLLERMPSGLDHMVGETGWQLSQGERSRVFLARALLQNADLVVLDESLAALDPENLGQCLKCVRQRAKTLLVIAHP